jgi:ribosomal protein S12 methylthiotransferase
MDELVEEARSLGDTEELILVAQDTTRYGEDQGQNNFVNLIKKISKLDNICHIRLLYCYPEKIDGALIAEIRDNPKILKYLDIPLQHSENRILKLMGRRGTREEYGKLFERLRREIPGIALRTTFITGFPSETEEEHRALISFIKEQKFENAGIFAYSREPETPAYKMKGQIPAGVKKRRQRELYAAQREVSKNLRSFVGKTLPVVCDGVNEEGTGFTGRAYFQAPEIDGNVFFTSPRAKEGEIYHIRIEEATDYDLIGTAVSD